VKGPWRIGRIASQPGLVATPAAKSLLYERTGALAVDMESDAVRRSAMLAGIRLVIVRAITDTAAQGINDTVLNWITPTGQIRLVPLTLGLLRRPWLILDLSRLWQSSRLAGKNLAQAVRQIIATAAEFIDAAV
jgi:adenosylhomocysteine nucleosidase